jgi:hypothetical protein
VEIICGAVIGPITEPRDVVAGLARDGEPRIVGRSTPLKTAAPRELDRWLQSPRGILPWPATMKGAALDRFNRDKEPAALTLVEPVAAEVIRRHGLVRQVLPPPGAHPPRKARTFPRRHRPAGTPAPARRGATGH